MQLQTYGLANEPVLDELFWLGSGVNWFYVSGDCICCWRWVNA